MHDLHTYSDVPDETCEHKTTTMAPYTHLAEGKARRGLREGSGVLTKRPGAPLPDDPELLELDVDDERWDILIR